MWGTHIFDGLGSLLKRTSSDVSEGTSDVIDSDINTSSGRFTGEGFEQHDVETENGRARIFVTGRTMASYFEGDEEYSPTIVSVSGESYAYRPRRTVVDTPVGDSPADLFINAIRKPARTITEDAEPVIIRKERIAPVSEPVISVSVEAPVVQIAEVTVEPVVIEDPAPVSEPVISEPTAEPEISIETVEIESAEILESAVDSAIPQIEPVVEDVAEVCEEVPETVPESPATYSLPESEKVVLALPPKLEIVMLPEASMESEVAVEETEPVIAEPSLPKKIEIEELEPVSSEETQMVGITDLCPVPEATPTSAAGVMEKPTVDILVDTETIPAEEYVVSNLDCDVLLAFVPGLREESEEFICTSVDSNSGFPEDELDRTECTFKLKTHRRYPMFDGYLRHIANH